MDLRLRPGTMGLRMLTTWTVSYIGNFGWMRCAIKPCINQAEWRCTANPVTYGPEHIEVCRDHLDAGLAHNLVMGQRPYD